MCASVSLSVSIAVVVVAVITGYGCCQMSGIMSEISGLMYCVFDCKLLCICRYVWGMCSLSESV